MGVEDMWKKTIIFLLTTLLAVGILGCMLWYVRDDIIIAVQYVVYPYLAGAVLLGIGTWILRGGRYQYVLRQLKTRCGLIFSTASILICQLVNIIVPARLGDFMRVGILRRSKGMEYTDGFSSVIEERLFDIGGILLLALLSLISLYPLLDVWMVQLIGLVLVLGIIALTGLYLSKYFHSQNKILTKILDVVHTIRSLSLTPFPTSVMVGFSVIIWLCEAFICFLIVQMFQVSVSFVVVLFAVMIANISKTIPLTPGGIGVYEVIVAGVLSLGGVPFASATLIAVIDHLIKNMIPIIGGAISLYYFGDWAKSLLGKVSRRGKGVLEEE